MADQGNETGPELIARGRALRGRLPRRDLAPVFFPTGRDPIAILAEQNTTRLQDLVPVRIGRMLQSPFAFYRGTAAVMAHDLKDAPTSDVDVVSCGDAHISNFGFYASPERELVFDLNDFDEGGIAPWEWDVRRMAASIHLAGRANSFSESTSTDAVVAAVEAYRTALRQIMELSATDRYFVRADTSELAQRFGKAGRRMLKDVTTKARRRTSEQVMRKLTTTTEDGLLRIVDQPPILRHDPHATLAELSGLFDQYLSTCREDVAFLLSKFRVVDFALRVVGVGSVGTRCYLLALQGPSGEALFLQAKEAGRSVLTSYGGRSPQIPGRQQGDPRRSAGHRVVAAQRVLQATSDPFLGWITGWAGDLPDRPRTDYYWRQFRDMKGSIDTSTLSTSAFSGYGQLCATLLARAHGQSRNAFTARGYLGRSDAFARATATWAAGYADVAEADYEELRRAVKTGRLPAETGI